MVLQITNDANLKIKTPLATEPIIILKVFWPSGNEFYSEKTIIFDGNSCKDIILEKGNLQSQIKEGSIGEISSLDIMLDDTSGDLKNLINTDTIEGTPVTLYHHYEDLATEDAIVILAGKITGPIVWSEGERTLSFSLESFSGTGAGQTGFAPEEGSIPDLFDQAIGEPWPIVFGSPQLVRAVLVQKIEPTEDELIRNPEMLPHDLIYIANLVSSSTVSGVYAKRNCYGEPGFFKIPTSHYSINLDYSYGGQNVTVIKMNQPLSSVDDSGWNDEIFVTLTSSLSSNTAMQIKWILETYTSLIVDVSSFNDVSNKISNVPSHWALFNQEDPLSLVEKMAWQARCGLFVKNNIVYIKFLADSPNPNFEISYDIAKFKSIVLSFTQTEDIITKFIAEYVTDYSGEEDSNKKYIYSYNIGKFGTIPETYDFQIYTNPECVQLSAKFWGYKYSNSWRKISVITFLPALPVEAYDWITVNLPIFSNYALPARVLISNRNIEEKEISFELEVASSASRHINGQPSLDSGYWDSSGSVPSISVPKSSVELLTTCIPKIDRETISKISEEIDNCIQARSMGGVGLRYDVCEIINIDQDGIVHVDVPSADNLPPDKIVFVKEHFLGLFGCVYSAASEPQWCSPDRSWPANPNWGSSQIKVGDTVGTVKGSTQLAKSRSGFNVVGIDAGYIAVTNGVVEEAIKIKSEISIQAYEPVEAVSKDGDYIVVRQPSENSIPAGKIIFPLTDIPAGGTGLGKNAFDVSPFVDGVADSENPNAEMGTKAGSSGLYSYDDEGNPLTGFIRILGEEGKHQVRPFLRVSEFYFALLFYTNPLKQWGTRKGDFSWQKSCYIDNNCQIIPQDYYKIIYVKVRNGVLSDYDASESHNLDIPFTKILHRTWHRADIFKSDLDVYLVQPSFWSNCHSKAYFAKHESTIDNYHFKLPNGQELRISSNIFAILITTGTQSKTFYHNITDSWIDVGLFLKIDEKEYPFETWRVYGQNPDPWDAPTFVKDNWSQWPPQPLNPSESYFLRTCNHLSQNQYGTIQENNVESYDDIFSQTVPNETAIIPVKGAVSGYYYTEGGQLNENEFVYETVSTQIKKIRIEKFENYYKFYFSYGDDKPTWSNVFVDLITTKNGWDKKIYGITFNLSLNGLIEIIYQGSQYQFPIDINENIIFDTELSVNKLKKMIPTDIEEVFSKIEDLSIYTQDWIQAGWNSENIHMESCSLVRKPRVI